MSDPTEKVPMTEEYYISCLTRCLVWACGALAGAGALDASRALQSDMNDLADRRKLHRTADVEVNADAGGES